ncbi:hypothetical protein [Streptomyces sp. NPDC049881]|uniref:hypothetical protein n=1 Tax=Streptomyces sp. NPDC049881 TaxID=3155778 RepID=UPI003447B5B2
MRSSIRLALPALVAATALTLTACGDDDADSGNNNAGDSQESNGATEEESEAPAEETPAEETASEEPAAEEGTVPEIDDLRGDWYVDTQDQDNSHNLTFYGAEEIIFIEDMTAEGDMCSAGTYADGALSVTDCMLGDDRSAELRLADDGTLNVTWDSGESESYTNTVPGGAGFTEDIYEQFLGQLDEFTAGLGG